ncbi:MAG: hypothetical protein IJ607_08125, partial [Bacteroidaceae bacterium]|nr:hypothetical protein [Bacteroidaceae bacterium]
RRSLVRTRTSTTPVGVGSVRVGEVGAPEDGFIRYYAEVQGGEVSVTGCGASWGGWCSRRRIHPLLCGGARRGGFGDGLGTSWGGWCSRRRIHPLLCGGR